MAGNSNSFPVKLSHHGASLTSVGHCQGQWRGQCKISWLRMPGRLATPTSNWLRMRRGDGTQEKAQAAEEPRQLSLSLAHSHCPRTQYSSLPCLGHRPLSATTCYCYRY
ncbi:hypothetical protein V8C35DRAFT_289638 [Trichoderma chlorosporum]